MAESKAKQEKEEKEGKNESTDRSAQIDRIIRDHVMFSMAAGAIPLPLLDIAAVTAIQMDMLKQMAKRYDINFDDQVGKSIGASLTSATFGSLLGRIGASAVKTIPGIGTALGIGSQVVLAGASTFALGKVFQSHFDEDGTLFDFDAGKMRDSFRGYMRRGRDVAREMNRKRSKEDILATIERLKTMKDEGTITEQDFEATKKELLAKLAD